MTAVQRAIVRRDATAGPRVGDARFPRLAEETRPQAEAAQPTCWTLTEGAAGMVSQVTGLAAAIGFPHTHHKVEMHWPFSTMWPALLPPWNGVFTDRALIESESPPRVAISCGRLGSAASLALKRRYGRGVFTIHIQDPKLPIGWFDLIVAPAHDGLIGDNVVQSLGAVHHLAPDHLRAAAAAGPTREMQCLTRPFVGVILGGPNRYYDYRLTDVRCLIQRLHEIVQREGVQLAVVPSRRTPPQILAEFRIAFGQRHFLWDGTGTNPYLAVLTQATHLIVTGDSVSMTSEAAATCKPVYVFHLTERRSARRFRQFHQSFEKAGITRPFAGRLESWTYPSPDRTGLIAQLIRHHLRTLP